MKVKDFLDVLDTYNCNLIEFISLHCGVEFKMRYVHRKQDYAKLIDNEELMNKEIYKICSCSGLVQQTTVYLYKK